VRDGDCGNAGFAPEVNGKCIGASKTELMEEESGGRGSCVGVSIELLVRAHITYVSMNMSLETTIPDQT
jgi:hypothetical protein